MKRKMLLAALCIAVVMGGCGKKKNTDAEPTPAPTESVTPTVSATPEPEEVLAPEPISVVYKEVGEKTADSVELLMENKMSVDIEELYVRESDESDWGENLMSSDTVIATGDTAKIYIEEKTAGAAYDIKLICSEDKIEILEEVDPSEIEEAEVYLLEEEDLPYLKYVSATTGKTVNTMDEVLERHGLGDSSASGTDDTDDDDSDDDKTDPTPAPTKKPTPEPTRKPTPKPTREPEPTDEPEPEPTDEPDPEPTGEPDPGEDPGDDAPPPDDDAE